MIFFLEDPIGCSLIFKN